MDKAKAMERLDAIEKEAKELREIIDGKSPIVFNGSKVYVTNRFEGFGPYILAGQSHPEEYYRFHSFDNTYCGWTISKKSGQEAIDSMIKDGYEVREFADTREAFMFFLDNYKG